MKPISLTAVVLTALLQAVNADFNLYRVGIGGDGITGNSEGWQVYQDNAGCDNELDWIWRESDDVSGGQYGVRCEGDGCERGSDSNPSDIDLVEMNFDSDEHHWTFYKDRDGSLHDLSDNRVGRCLPSSNEEFSCGLSTGRVEGVRKLRCEIEGVSANDINVRPD
ncbi:hypothetical protein BDV95DRAFT_158257 [Massariosphaeria phaeospora]|uniref:Ricin B lectin domain-containing protein n=1 Tax=Massariosphaeria phaeospora TaxID=100035 RepID=A0A7C8M402_9PLEO|nr:hypothetical protein BDV95DRAFT_158257 [Massariosphaeria phaeospora]